MSLEIKADPDREMAARDPELCKQLRCDRAYLWLLMVVSPDKGFPGCVAKMGTYDDG